MSWHFKSKNDPDETYRVRFGRGEPSTMTYSRFADAADAAQPYSVYGGSAEVLQGGRSVARYVGGQRVDQR